MDWLEVHAGVVRAMRTRDAQKTGWFNSLVKITQLYIPRIISYDRRTNKNLNCHFIE